MYRTYYGNLEPTDVQLNYRRTMEEIEAERAGAAAGKTGGTGKIDDFAKEPFLPDEYYQKIDDYLAKATAARDAEVARIQALSKTQQSKYTTVVAGVDLRTGEVIVGSKNSIIYKGQAICAEDLVISKFIPPSNANIIMTSAIRPRTGQVIAVCTRCQTKFPVNQFIQGTVFD